MSKAPTRRRRAGSRPGELSPELQGALRDEVLRLAAKAKPVDRIKAVNEVYAQMDFELDQFADARFEAIRELRALGWSYDRISKATGLSKARVAQLSRSARSAARR